MKKISQRFVLIIAVVLCVISMVGSSLITCDFGKVQVINVSTKTKVGTLTGYLLVPASASITNKVPAVVVGHGAGASSEDVDAWYIELSRRGYVVFAPNLYGHGDSSSADKSLSDTINYQTNGLYDAVEYLYGLEFVDQSRIGITGHSLSGGSALTTATYYSNLERDALANGTTAKEAHALNKIAAVLSVGYPVVFNPEFAGFSTTATFDGLNTDLGVIIGSADDFQASLSHDMLKKKEVFDWLRAQTGIQETANSLTEGMIYVNPENGYTFTMWNPLEVHNQNIISSTTAGALIDFFENSLGAPKPLSSSNQIWLIKKLLNLVGLIGFLLFILPCAYYILQIPHFNNLKTSSITGIPPLTSGKEKRKFYLTTFAGSLVNLILLVPLVLVGSLYLVYPIWPQSGTSGFALWSVIGGLITIWMVRIGFGKKFKGNGEELGTKITRNQFAKTLVLSCIVVGCTYLLVFSAKYFFNSDFRFWSYAIRPFGAGRVLQAVRYLPLFAVFHIANALAVYRNNFTNWSENKRIAFSTLACLLPILIMLVITYVPILFTGVTLWSGSGTNLLMLAAANGVIRLYPFVITLAVISIINVKTQKLTGNIWLGTLINTLLFTMITVANFDSTINF